MKTRQWFGLGGVWLALLLLLAPARWPFCVRRLQWTEPNYLKGMK
ncbi:hypothetical protein [Oceanisphaera psychrotolerans]|nr:hypothetical protein [Oceanisphaera psychrotolerans]